MELNNKKLERTSKIIYYTISCLLCLFLILLSSRIIGDLDGITSSPQLSQFENQQAIALFDKQLQDNQTNISTLEEKKSQIINTIQIAKENHQNEKQSFENWLQTRKTLGSPDKDQEVLSRAQQLDAYYKVEQEWRKQQNLLQQKIDSIGKINQTIQSQQEVKHEEAWQKYNGAQKRYDLKVFIIRLLFVSPILALGIFFFVRYRRHKFWPLFFGFTLFSVYAFFFGLVPYLPSYGGYVRYSVGVALSLGIGYYAIKRIRTYVEQKQAELRESTQDRALKVESHIAEKALESHICPSCGKDFLVKRWEKPIQKNNDSETFKFVTDFCRHCGLELFKNCAVCGHKNFVHLPFCACCGTTITSTKQTETSDSIN